MYNYIIVLKNGKEYKIESDLAIADLLKNLIPLNQYEFKFSHFNIVESDNLGVAILGSEIASVEYFINRSK